MTLAKSALFLLAVLCVTANAVRVKVNDGRTVCACTLDYTPVCASNGITYANACDFECARDEAIELNRAEITLRTNGECPL